MSLGLIGRCLSEMGWGGGGGIYNLGHSLLSEPLKGAIEDFMHLFYVT